jgi:hypothetical protein
MTHGRSPSWPLCGVAAQAGPVPAAAAVTAHGRGSHARAGARRSAQPLLCHGAQVVGDTGGLMDALGIDRAHISGGNMGGTIAASKMALDQIQKYFFTRMDLSAHDYLRWTRAIRYRQ